MTRRPGGTNLRKKPTGDPSSGSVSVKVGRNVPCVSGSADLPAAPMDHPEAPEARTWTIADLAEHRPALRAAAGSLCRQPADIDDLIQDTFERALRFLRAGQRPPARMVGWLVTIMRNVFIDRVRKRTPALQPLEDRFAAEDDGPGPRWSELSVDELRAAVAGLEAGFAAPIELHYIQGLRYREVAERLGIPENTVASRLSRARKALHTILARSLSR